MSSNLHLVPPPPFSWRKAIWKGAKTSAGFLASAAWLGTLQVLADEPTLLLLLKEHPEMVGAHVFVVWAARTLLNRQKQKAAEVAAEKAA